MNFGNVPPTRRRRQCIQHCRAIIKYLESEDGHEEIDSLLDAAFDELAKITVLMSGFHRRAVEERERLEREVANKRAALTSHPVTVVPTGVSGKRRREREDAKNFLKSMSKEEKAAFLSDLLGHDDS